MAGVESLWKDYCAYENGVNPLIAKKMIDDRLLKCVYVSSKDSSPGGHHAP